METDPPPRFYTDGASLPDVVELRPIGVVRSPHRERHGTPRQANIAADPSLRPDESASLELFEHCLPERALADLEAFDRIWIVAYLHLNQGWNAKVIPPRGPRIARGLFATRAPHRPNPIGLSSARVLGVEGRLIRLERVDLLDGTPVLDIKPYLPSADAFPEARAGWVDEL